MNTYLVIYNGYHYVFDNYLILNIKTYMYMIHR